MKKQILFLAMFTLALFAGNAVFGQVTVRDLDCVVSEGPLNPLLGKTYTYSVTVPNIAEFTSTGPVVNVTYQWRVTTDKIFMDATGVIATAKADGTDFDWIATGSATYNVADAENQISLSWNTLATETNPFFLLVNVLGDNQVCTPQNLKVYKIVPVNQFTLDIANVDPVNGILDTWNADGTALLYQECVQDVQSVYWNQDTETATYDYGSNTLVWAVGAANWSVSWTPTLQITGVTGSLISSVTWNTAADGSGTSGSFTESLTIPGTWETTDVVEPSSGSDVGPLGETVYIIVELDHTDIATTTFFEGLIEQNITVAIDGVTANGDEDVHWFDDPATAAPNTDDCGLADGFDNDMAQQDLLPRPGIDTNTPLGTGTDPLLTPVIQP